MKFGIFYEHQLPRPWSEHAEHELLQNSLIQIELADKLGYDYAWEVEHHFLEEYSHSSAPEVFLAAASQRTKQIRLAHGIIQLTTNHPARVAERVSTLDLLSNGRVEMGIGEGSSITELHPFDRRFRDKRAVWEDAVKAIIPMFGDGGCEYHGEYFDFPLRNVLPKPYQKPHPPLWVACSQLETIDMAARRGMGALGFQFVSADAAVAWVNTYYNSFVKRQEKLADYATNPNIALVSGFMCCPDDDEALRKADGDAAALARVFRDAVLVTAADHYDADQRQAWSAAADDPTFPADLAKGLTMVAEWQQETAGFAQLVDDRITLIYVHPDTARLGIATLLYQHLEDEARIQGRERLVTEASQVAHDFFLFLGFQPEAEETVKRDGVALSRWRMHKSLI